jgi:hypothetical protein
MNERTRLQVLERLARTGRAGWGELLDAQDASLPEFHATLAALEAEGTIVVEKGAATLSARGRAEWHAGHEGAPLDLSCRACDGKGYAVRADHAALRRLEALLAGRPEPDLGYDQGAITPADALLRAAFLEERGDLRGRDLLLVGDFDLMSLALALTGQPRRVVVLEIDRRVVDFVNAAAAREGLRVSARPFDVREPIPAALERSFDAFLCDPVETLAGISLYLSRGASALRGEGAAAYLGLTTLEASRGKWWGIQGVLHDMGFVLTDARRRFSDYPDHDGAPAPDSSFEWPVLQRLGTEGTGHRWYRSAFLRAEAVRVPAPAVTGAVALGPELYVDDEAWATPRPRT